jgi:sec-independent protein translocase protein TatA
MNTLLAFALGGPEVMMVFVIALLLFGAKKLPELARGMGKSMGEFKKAREEFEREISTAEVTAKKDWDAPKAVAPKLDAEEKKVDEIG